MKRFTIIMIILVLLEGCGKDESSNNNITACGSGSSPYYGCWDYTTCISNDFEPEGPNWQAISLNFTSNNKIIQKIKSYTNSTCTGTPKYDSEFDADYTFEEMGPETLPSGLTGYRLRMFGIDEAQILVAITASNQICISNNFYFSAGAYRIRFPISDTDVDYSNCFGGT